MLIKQTINPDYPQSGWVMWGVSKPAIFNDRSYKTAFGIASSHKQYFPWDSKLKAKVKHNDISLTHFFMRKGEVDILLDCDKKELRICLVGKCDELKEAKLWNVQYIEQEDIKLGFVPHINLHALESKCRIAKIPVEWYGQKEKCIFQQNGMTKQLVLGVQNVKCVYP